MLYVALAGRRENGRRKSNSEGLVERICKIGMGCVADDLETSVEKLQSREHCWGYKSTPKRDLCWLICIRFLLSDALVNLVQW
jgi:hypothetical protein